MLLLKSGHGMGINGMLGYDRNGHSIAWHSDGDTASFYYKDKKYRNFNQQSTPWNNFNINEGFKNNCKRTFFMLEIDLIERSFIIVCNVNGIIIEHPTIIPNSLLKEIQETNKFRIGLSLCHNPGFSVGLVKI